MKLQNDARPDAGTTEIALPYALRAPGRRHFHRPRGLLIFLTIGGMLGLLIIVASHPAFSQGVQLVKVDVQVVADGYRVSGLTGHLVVNDTNQNIGKIDDFVIGRDAGHPLFAILQVGGFLGLGSHLVAVPYDSLMIDQSGKKIELPGASKAQLEKLTQFRYGS
jgi:hypothetical protein